MKAVLLHPADEPTFPHLVVSGVVTEDQTVIMRPGYAVELPVSTSTVEPMNAQLQILGVELLSIDEEVLVRDAIVMQAICGDGKPTGAFVFSGIVPVRVLRPDGRIAIASWTPEGLTGQFNKITASYMPPPPKASSRRSCGEAGPRVRGNGAGPGVRARGDEEHGLRLGRGGRVATVAKFSRLPCRRRVLPREVYSG